MIIDIRRACVKRYFSLFFRFHNNEYGCGAIAFDPYTHGYYKVSERVGEAFKDGLKLR